MAGTWLVRCPKEGGTYFHRGDSREEMSDYFEYLSRRNPLSYVYRKWILYPRYRSLLPGGGIDVGCGLGDFLSFTGNFVGVDVNDKVVDYCREQGLDVSLGSVYDLPFEDGFVENAILDNVFEHLDRPPDCLRELSRVLKPGGRILLVVPNRRGWKLDATHITFWDETNLPQLVTQEGFDVLKARHFPLPSKAVGNISAYNVFYLLARKKSA
ncbi:MAG: class I SAM-dependent methyltransferase [Thermoanaerobaculia bacterium]